MLPPIGSRRHHQGLTAEDVREPILAGVQDACADLASNFHVTAAEIIENDTPQPSVYRLLARNIVLYAAGRMGD
ncbi:hypothetical protein [Sphingomonas sp.]|uniref:hypothetical protein n=1 Tax=Sphingomonas sp. TaxID=28214 RepID=UPI001B296B90|nr:hypothetical protein [Sphingomonas sp.]MBO9712428.1 hypothetical protein [Sphingomonas sp.]